MSVTAVNSSAERAAGATITLLKQLDLVGMVELEAAIAEAIARGTPHLAAVRHVLERRRHERGQPPPLGAHVLRGERALGPVVTPHSLSDYDDIGRADDNDK